MNHQAPPLLTVLLQLTEICTSVSPDEEKCKRFVDLCMNSDLPDGIQAVLSQHSWDEGAKSFTNWDDQTKSFTDARHWETLCHDLYTAINEMQDQQWLWNTVCEHVEQAVSACIQGNTGQYHSTLVQLFSRTLEVTDYFQQLAQERQIEVHAARRTIMELQTELEHHQQELDRCTDVNQDLSRVCWQGNNESANAFPALPLYTEQEFIKRMLKIICKDWPSITKICKLAELVARAIPLPPALWCLWERCGVNFAHSQSWLYTIRECKHCLNPAIRLLPQFRNKGLYEGTEVATKVETILRQPGPLWQPNAVVPELHQQKQEEISMVLYNGLPDYNRFSDYLPAITEVVANREQLHVALDNGDYQTTPREWKEMVRLLILCLTVGRTKQGKDELSVEPVVHPVACYMAWMDFDLMDHSK